MNFISSEAARHPQPFHYYLPLLMGGLFPWSFLLPVALVRPFWEGFKNIDDGVLYLVLWFGAVLVFFSAASSKLGPYILPLFPAASLLVGFLWRELFFAPTANLRNAFVTCTGLLAVGMLAGLTYLFTNQPVELETRYGVDLLRVNGLSVFVSLMVAAAFFLVATQRYRTAFATNIATVFMGIVLFMTVIAPLINPYRSSKRLALSLNHSAPPGEAFVFFRKPRDSVLFYTNRNAVILHKPAHLIDYLADHPAAYAFISRYHFSVFPEIGKASKIVDQEGSDLIIGPKSSEPPTEGAHRQ
jgi:4-amino-4-deoxy-L-arabinose transferase-like glycosyltransferase